MLSVPVEPAFAAIVTTGPMTLPPSAIVSVPVPELPILNPAMSLQSGARAGHRHGTVRACAVADICDEGVISMTLPPFATVRVPVPKLPILSPACVH